MSLAMTRAEREGFLAEVHVGVLSVAQEGLAPLSVPIWYAYEPGGEVRLVTGRSSRKGLRIAATGRISLCVQTETPPYRYVSVEGPVTGLDEVDLEKDLRPIARRYLGTDLGDRYVAETGGEENRAESMLVRMRPVTWLTVDYRKQFGSV